MVSLGETITIRASKFQTRYQTGDGRFAICAFTAKPAEKDKLPDGLRMYGTTAMFLASGRIPESDKGVQFALTGAWAKNKRGAGKKGEEKIFETCLRYEDAQDVGKNLTRRWGHRIGCALPAGTCWETGTARGARRKSGMRGSATGAGRHGRNRHSGWRAELTQKVTALTALCVA